MFCSCEYICNSLHVKLLIILIYCTEFQNYLRTQAGNNTTVNIVICTVDYLLRLQVGQWSNCVEDYK